MQIWTSQAPSQLVLQETSYFVLMIKNPLVFLLKLPTEQGLMEIEEAFFHVGRKLNIFLESK